MTTTTLTTPTVHMNGTGFLNLWTGYENADDALNAFQRSFQNIEFNARDYYVQGAEAFTQARKERQEVFQKLNDIKDYLDAIRMSLDKQRPATRN